MHDGNTSLGPRILPLEFKYWYTFLLCKDTTPKNYSRVSNNRGASYKCVVAYNFLTLLHKIARFWPFLANFSLKINNGGATIIRYSRVSSNIQFFEYFKAENFFLNVLPIKIEILAHRLEQIGNHVICSCVLPKNMTLKAASILVKTGHDLTCFHSEKIFLSLLRCKANDGYFEKLIIEIIRQMMKEMI